MGTAHLAVCCLAILVIVINSSQGATIPLQDLSRSKVLHIPNARADNLSYFLPTDIVPSEYTITLKPNFDDFYFDGEVSISVNVGVQTKVIQLHYGIMNITYLEIKNSTDDVIATNETIDDSYDEETEIYTITLPDDLQVGTYTILITYRGYLLDDMFGFYRSSYTSKDGTVRWLGTTHFESTGARRAFPCFDEPKFKAKFQVNIIRTKDRWSISNTPLKETIPNVEGDLDKDVFDTTPPMSSYLVAFIVSDFKFISTTLDGRNYSIWAREDAISQANYSLTISPHIIKWLEDFTDLPFEFTKMDEAAIPDFSAGAMENWGLVTYRERALLFDENESTTSNKKSIATTIAHEFAHQWFGDLVSPNWWKFTWLNEGFATYFGYFATTEVQPDWCLEEQFVVDSHQNALDVDSSDSSHPITCDVYSPAQINSIFDSISYDKAGSVIRMMEHFLTTKVFKEGLRNYLKAMNHQTATADDLFDKVGEQQELSDIKLPEGLTLKLIMNTWTLQSGYPLITVTRNGSNYIHISQEWYPRKTSDKIWYVPITYTVSSELIFTDTYPKDWLVTKEKDLDVVVTPEEWIILNIQETGFYRVLYDEENYQSLINFLKSEKSQSMHVLNRAQLIDDSLKMAHAGILSYDIALDLTKYLTTETDYIPWVSFFNGITYLNNRLIGKAIYDNFKEYMRSLLINLYNYIGFEESADDTDVTRLHRVNALTWTCNFEHQPCIEKASALFSEFMNNGVTVTPDLKSLAYCYGISNGGRAEWDFLWERYESTQLSSEQVLILNALGCSKDSTMLQEFLKMAINSTSGVRRQDSNTVFTSVYSRPFGIDVALDFLINNFDDMQNYFSSKNILSIIYGIASRINTEEQISKIKKFIEDHLAEIPGGTEVLVEVIQNSDWFNKYEETLTTWFQPYATTTSTETITTTGTGTTSTSSTTSVTTTGTTTTTDSASTPATTVFLYLGVLFTVFYLHF